MLSNQLVYTDRINFLFGKRAIMCDHILFHRYCTCEVRLFHRSKTEGSKKKSSPWYTCELSLYQVSAISVHYFWRYELLSERHFHFLRSDFVACSRNLWTTQTHFCQYLRTRWIFFKTDFCVETLGSSRSFWVPWTLYSEIIITTVQMNLHSSMTCLFFSHKGEFGEQYRVILELSLSLLCVSECLRWPREQGGVQLAEPGGQRGAEDRGCDRPAQQELYRHARTGTNWGKCELRNNIDNLQYHSILDQ